MLKGRLGYTPIKLADPDEAIQMIRHSLTGWSPATEKVPVEDSVGRVSAADIYAGRDIPDRDVSAMDGVALRWRDIAYASPDKPVRLHLVDGPEIGPGQAARIFTGELIPNGADTVVKIENVVFDASGGVILHHPETGGKNVVHKGSDIAAGRKIVSRGSRISPMAATLLMVLGIEEVEVYARPSAGIICVGDELHQNYMRKGLAGISYAFLAIKQMEKFGVQVSVTRVVPDDEKLFRETVLELFTSVDAVITIGGSSVGGNDIVKSVVENLRGARPYFSGIQHNPFKSSGYTMADKPVLMLPGNAVSLAAAIHYLGSVLAAGLQGLDGEPHVFTQARLTASVKPKNNMRTSYLVRLEKIGDEIVAHPMGWATNSLRNLSEADGFVTVDKNKELEADSTVLVSLL